MLAVDENVKILKLGIWFSNMKHDLIVYVLFFPASKCVTLLYLSSSFK
jgi:hypothetical protein